MDKGKQKKLSFSRLALFSKRTIMKYSKELVKKVGELSTLGLSNRQIMDYLGICEATFYDWKKNKLEFSKVLEKKRIEGIEFATSKLFELIAEKNLGAICFFLKSKAGWTERQEIDIKQEIKQEKQKIDLSKMSESELKELIVVENVKTKTK